MTTTDHDFVRLYLIVGSQDLPCVSLGLEWPPPERLYLGLDGWRAATEDDDERFVMVRTNMSRLTDEIIEGSNHLIRGAEYSYVNEG